MSDVNPSGANDLLTNILDWAGKAAVVLGSLKLALVGIYKPFMEWRRKHNAKMIREVLDPELKQLQSIIDDETGCAHSMREVLVQMRAIFTDLDMFLEVAHDNRERIDETNELLDAVGFSADRRMSTDRRQQVTDNMNVLFERRRARRRALVILDPPPDHDDA